MSHVLEKIGGVNIKEMYTVDDSFTKEELQSFLFLVEKHCGECSMTFMSYKPLIKKIKDRIEKHCEHQPIWETPNHVICYCQVCKKVLEK